MAGASNTGKSFALKSIDFILGSATPLPDITERQPYERAWLALDLPEYGLATLRRALAGGPFELFPGDIQFSNGMNSLQLSARHDSANTDNLSQFILEEPIPTTVAPSAGEMYRTPWTANALTALVCGAVQGEVVRLPSAQNPAWRRPIA